MPTPPIGQVFSTFQLGTWNPATDTWTQLYDLNQPTTGPVWIMNKYPQWTAGEKYDSRSTTMRTLGERIVETNLKNGHWKVKVTVRGSSTAVIATLIRGLAQALEQPQLCIRYAAPGASQYLYFDVRKTVHNLHQAPAQEIIAGVQQGLIDFECFPLARGDRLTLQNLVYNPGFEAPSGNVQAFTDSFGNANAYTAGTVAATALTLTNGTFAQFGSPGWGPIYLWTIRFQWITGLTATFYAHWLSNNSQLLVSVTGTTISLVHVVAGVSHTLATHAITLTNNNFYWLEFTQFPNMPNQAPFVQCNLFNDSAGSIGSAVSGASLGPVATFDAVTALVGRPALLATGATLTVGGVVGGNTMFLFGPASWTLQNFGAGTVSGAWEGNQSVGGDNLFTTYEGGAVFSQNSARIDCPPAGAVNAAWYSYNGGAPAGSSAMPVVAPGDVLGVSAAVIGSGLGGSATVKLLVNEYDVNGSFLRNGTVQTLSSSAITAWSFLSGNYTTGASCVYASISLFVVDATSGSANGTVWFDNVQCWDITATNETSMPYCELRFQQSPAQLMVSGLLGDWPAPIALLAGTFVSSLATGASLQFGIGRKATTGQHTVLVSTPLPPASGGGTPTLSTSAYGGFYVSENGVAGSFIYPNLGIMVPMPDTMGIYHLICLLQTQESSGNIFTVFAQLTSAQQDPNLPTTKGLSAIPGALLTPFTLASTWQAVDLGYLAIPGYPLNVLAAQNLFDWGAWVGIDDAAGTSPELAGWLMLLPYDAETILGQIINPTGYSTVTNQWVWFFNDGLTQSQRTLVPQTWQMQAIGTTYSVSNRPYPQPQYAVSGPGVSTGPFLAINPTGSSFLRVDPTQSTPGSTGLGVNQFGAYITDNSGDVLPLIVDIQYSPYYLYQR